MNFVEKILFSKKEIKNKVNYLAQKIDENYKNIDDIVLIGILKGSYMFLSDLSRALKKSHFIDFMSVSSYADTESTGNLKIECDLRHSIKDKNVIIVEDIVDTGRTLVHLKHLLENRKPNSIEICTLFSKPSERKVSVDVKFVGFELNPPEFIVGYGLDYNEHFRNIPFVFVPNKLAIEKFKN